MFCFPLQKQNRLLMIRKTEGFDLQFVCCFYFSILHLQVCSKKLNTLNERLFIEVNKILAEPPSHPVHGCVSDSLHIYQIHFHQDN